MKSKLASSISLLPLFFLGLFSIDAFVLGQQNIDQATIAGHIRFLADDQIEGRGPGTKADELTQLYIATQMQGMGYQPAGENDTWTQQVPLVGITSQAPAKMEIVGDNQSISLKYYDEFIAVSGRAQPTVELPKSEIVFVGFGITAPEYDWDDYQSIDVKDKIVLIMNNDPEDDPELFEGRRRLYYGRWDYKYANAARHGAAAAIIIHTTPSAGYPFSVIQTSWSGEESELGEDNSPRMLVKAWVTDEVAHRIAELANQDLDALRKSANSRQFKAVPLGVTSSLRLSCEIRNRDTANVLGLLPGSDPQLADEYVILMAHHDHLGLAVQRDATGDNIYNGAIDNASGVATLLALAKEFALSTAKPKRSILLAAVGAEEQGLLGSKYFAAHPTVPVGKIAGLVNMDGLNFLGRTVDLQVIGYGKSSIDALVQQAATGQDRKVVPDQFIDRGYYYRSDQFSLAKVGVPGLYLHAGTTVRGKPEGWGREQLEAWTEKTYHQPGDQYDPNWDLSGAVEDTQLLFEIASAMANADEMQSWKAGDEFEAARKKAIAEAGSSNE